MLPASPFYFATIRKITGSFGALFGNMYIRRFSNNGNAGTVTGTIKVPIRYAGSEKALLQNTEKIAPQTDVRTRISYPRMSFDMVGFKYSTERKLNTLGHTDSFGVTDPTTLLKSLNPVPYDIMYQLNISVKNINDGLQIIEQILPYFTPSFNLSVKDIPELQIVKDVPIILDSVDFSDNYEGLGEDTRVINYRLLFTAKAYLYPPISNPEVIKHVIATIYGDDAMMVDQVAVINADVNPDTAYEGQVDTNGDLVYTIDTTIDENV
jgi:hypothetical protein